ncbi:hypothetical protein VTO58DRAFT_111245 [Aureobasidium pullulans]
MVRTRSQAAASKAKKQSRFDILPPELVGLILERTAGTGYLAPGSSDWAGTAVAVSGLSCASRLALELVNAYLATKCEEMHVYAQTHSLLSISGAFIRYRLACHRFLMRMIRFFDRWAGEREVAWAGVEALSLLASDALIYGCQKAHGF